MRSSSARFGRLAAVGALVTAAALGIRLGFLYPLGGGWRDEILDIGGIALASGGVILARLIPVPREGGPLSRVGSVARLAAAGGGLALILGQLPLTIGMIGIFLACAAAGRFAGV